MNLNFILLALTSLGKRMIILGSIKNFTKRCKRKRNRVLKENFMEFEEVLQSVTNSTIYDTLVKAKQVINSYDNVAVSISGGQIAM